MKPLSTILVTGASGIVGRNFLEVAKEEYSILAIARRSQKEAGIPLHPRIHWLQIDIANFQSLLSYTLKFLSGKCLPQNESQHPTQVDFVLHLASYYDYNYTPHSEYMRTNVKGTKNVLELAKGLKVKRFVFVSSLAAFKFPENQKRLTEKDPLDGQHPYAQSKRKGEEMVQEYFRFFPCSIVRPAAVFTDWCEYGLLYIFLRRWFSRKWGGRILCGKGDTAIPFIHAHDLNHLFLSIFKKSRLLPNLDTYHAGPDDATSHLELFHSAARYYFGKDTKPRFISKFLSFPLLCLRNQLLHLIGRQPFEKLWMLKYIDLRLETDSSYTREQLQWEPAPRFHILRRMLYLVEKMKNQPDEWHYMNTRAMKRVAVRKNFLLYEIMVELKDEIIAEIKQTLQQSARKKELSHYRQLNPEIFHWDVSVFYQFLTASVRNKDRLILMNYARDLLCPIRFSEGFQSEEVCTAILDTGKIILSRLLKHPLLKGMESVIHNYILLTLQLTVDEVENTFEKLSRNFLPSQLPTRSDIEEKLKKLATFCIQVENESIDSFFSI